MLFLFWLWTIGRRRPLSGRSADFLSSNAASLSGKCSCQRHTLLNRLPNSFQRLLATRAEPIVSSAESLVCRHSGKVAVLKQEKISFQLLRGKKTLLQLGLKRNSLTSTRCSLERPVDYLSEYPLCFQQLFQPSFFSL